MLNSILSFFFFRCCFFTHETQEGCCQTYSLESKISEEREKNEAREGELCVGVTHTRLLEFLFFFSKTIHSSLHLLLLYTQLKRVRTPSTQVCRRGQG